MTRVIPEEYLEKARVSIAARDDEESQLELERVALSIMDREARSTDRDKQSKCTHESTKFYFHGREEWCEDCNKRLR